MPRDLLFILFFLILSAAQNRKPFSLLFLTFCPRFVTSDPFHVIFSVFFFFFFSVINLHYSSFQLLMFWFLSLLLLLLSFCNPTQRHQVCVSTRQMMIIGEIWVLCWMGQKICWQRTWGRLMCSICCSPCSILVGLALSNPRCLKLVGKLGDRKTYISVVKDDEVREQRSCAQVHGTH